MDKIIIASDIHGSAHWCAELLSAFETEQADRLVLLGDLLYHGPRNDFPDEYSPRKVFDMLNNIKEKITCVRGNCDAEVDQMVLPFPIMAKTETLSVDGRTWFAAHGHRAGANPTDRDLPDLPAGSVVLSGHTHVPTCDRNEGGLLLLNPGSVSIPKGGFPASYAIYENGTFSVLDFAGNTVMCGTV